MKHRSYIFNIVMAVALMLPFTACHKNVYDDDGIYNNKWPKTTKTKTSKSDNTTTSTTRKASGGKQSAIPEEWRTLDIKLERGDNKALYREIKAWLGTPYKYAAMDKGVGSDCSGFTMQLYLTVYNKKIDRNSSRQFTQNCKEISRDDLKEGDLVFFNGKTPGRITHVGIYLKQGYFAHASSSGGVCISSLDQRYYVTHFQCAGRVK